MTPQQFLSDLKSGSPAPLYLFLGPEMYRRRVCRKMLLDACLPPAIREEGLTRHDLDEVPLRDVIDDASSLSLFASERLLLVSSAEAALPKGAAKDEDNPGYQSLAAYAKNPVPGVVILFDARRITFDNDDKTKLDRLRRFYSPVRAQVEFAPYTLAEARKLAADLAQRAGLRIAPPVLDLLVESLGGDAARLANEIDKLSLYKGPAEAVTEADIALLSPDARETTIFALVTAVGRGDRASSLDLLETLVREGEYLPLALTFLGAQFRFALAAREEGLKTPQQIQGHFSRLGVPMWSSRAQQVVQTLNAFSRKQLEQALVAIYDTDKGLRDRSPDDRILMERLVLQLTR